MPGQTAVSHKQLSFLPCSTHSGGLNPKSATSQPGASAFPSQFSYLQNGHECPPLGLWEDHTPAKVFIVQSQGGNLAFDKLGTLPQAPCSTPL